MSRKLSALTASAIAAAALITVPAANAASNIIVSNSAGNVTCQVFVDGNGTHTLCVSDIARGSQPQCNPPAQLIPAVSLNTGGARTHCWNQGFERAPERLAPLQIRTHGSATVIPWFDGSLYVFDAAKLGLIKAGGVNQVLFKLL